MDINRAPENVRIFLWMETLENACTLVYYRWAKKETLEEDRKKEEMRRVGEPVATTTKQKSQNTKSKENQ